MIEGRLLAKGLPRHIAGRLTNFFVSLIKFFVNNGLWKCPSWTPTGVKIADPPLRVISPLIFTVAIY